MTKNLTYFAFVIVSLLTVFAFVAAKSYPQLAVTIVLYPLLVFLAFKIFPRSSLMRPQITAYSPPKLGHGKSIALEPNQGSAHVADIDRRAFLKLIGATGISFFLFSIFGRRFESLLFGRAGQTEIGLTRSDNQNALTGGGLTSGYKISEIDEGPVTYYGFTNIAGEWQIMREGKDGSTFRYAKGGSDFPGNWQNRENLRYDYYHNLF